MIIEDLIYLNKQLEENRCNNQYTIFELQEVIDNHTKKIDTIITNYLKTKSGHCVECKQKLPIITKYCLSRNIIKVLLHIHYNMNDKGYFCTKQLYSMNNHDSNTAFLTQLKYFGAIEPHFIQEDKDKLSTRSGKYKLTSKGLDFIRNKIGLPKCIEVYNKKVISKTPKVRIDDSSLKWKTEDDIWKHIKGLD